jgi:hypothetical protein
MKKTAKSRLRREGEWSQAEELFHLCVDPIPEARRKLLDAAPPEVRREVESLLSAFDLHRGTDIGRFTAEPELPARAGRYLLLRKLGSGGMATVYLAAFRGPDGAERRIALKCLAGSYASDEEFRRLFQYEAELSSQLDHPNIIQTYGLETIDRNLFLKLELVRGKDRGLDFPAPRPFSPSRTRTSESASTRPSGLLHERFDRSRG